MEEDEDIKKKVENKKNYDEFSIEDLLDEIYNLKKQLKYLENLLKNKKSGHKQADKLFKK
tara:strand:- start:630 stop:809 length:180 start_codon:yes stop_codon:yes gene_type:complete